MKALSIAIVTIALCAIQGLTIGLNGLTCVSIPLTIYLGLEVIEKVTQKEEEISKN